MSKFTDEWGRFTVVPNVFIEQAQNLSDGARWLFVLLRFYTHEKRECAWPSYGQLREVTGWGFSKVSNAIAELEKCGWLERRKRFGGSTEYVLRRPSATEIVGLENNGLNASPTKTPVLPKQEYSPTKTVGQSYGNSRTTSYTDQDEFTRRIEQDESMSNLRSTARGGSVSLSPAEEVFSYWQTVLQHPKAKLDSKRRRLIDARLKEGFSVEDLKGAVDGCKASSFHQGDNDRNRKYDGVGLIFRDAGKVEEFIDLRSVNGTGNGNGAAPKKQYCGNCYGGWLPSDPNDPEPRAKRCPCVEADRAGAPPVVTAPPGYRRVKTCEELGIRIPPEI